MSALAGLPGEITCETKTDGLGSANDCLSHLIEPRFSIDGQERRNLCPIAAFRIY
jgi:hypothetical protein